MHSIKRTILITILFMSYQQIMDGGFQQDQNKDCQDTINLYTDQNTNVVNLFNNVEILTCKTQVVAGMNYRMSLKLSSGETCSITLYKNLQNQVTVNDIYEDTCSQMAVSN